MSECINRNDIIDSCKKLIILLEKPELGFMSYSMLLNDRLEDVKEKCEDSLIKGINME